MMPVLPKVKWITKAILPSLLFLLLSSCTSDEIQNALLQGVINGVSGNSSTAQTSTDLTTPAASPYQSFNLPKTYDPNAPLNNVFVPGTLLHKNTTSTTASPSATGDDN